MVGLRDRLIRNRTRLSNAIPGYAAEFGLTAAKGKAHLVSLLESIQADESLPIAARELFSFPIFGRPVHPRGRPINYSPILLLKLFGFRIAPDTLPSIGLRRWPARHYPRLWIQRPSSELWRHFNPPDSCAAQRTEVASDFSCSCIIGYGSSPSRCGPVVSFPRPNTRPPCPSKKRLHMPGSTTTPGRPGVVVAALDQGINDLVEVGAPVDDRRGSPAMFQGAARPRGELGAQMPADAA